MGFAFALPILRAVTIVRRLCAWRSGSLELDAAFLCDRGLLNGNHLPLHLGQFGRGLLVAADQERRRPEDDDGGRGGDAVLCALTILRP